MLVLLLGYPPSWLSSNTTLLTCALVHYVVCSFPGDVPYRLVRRLSPSVELLLSFSTSLSRAHAITSGVEAVRSHSSTPISQSIVALVLVGTLCGCGGG